MTLAELQTNFGRTDGYFYRCLVPKTDLDLCNELQQSHYTFMTPTDKYICTDNPVAHPDYQPITD